MPAADHFAAEWSKYLIVIVSLVHLAYLYALFGHVGLELLSKRLSFISDASFAYRNYIIYGDDPALAAKYEAARQKGWSNLFDRLQVLQQLSPPEDQALLTKLDSDIRQGSLRIQEDTRGGLFGHGETG